MPGILDATQQQPMEGQQPQQTSETMPPETEGTEGGGLSFTSAQVEEGVKKELEGPALEDLDQILRAGNKVLFSKDTHYQIIDSIKATEGEPLADELAKGAVGLTYHLYDLSKGGMPAELISPAVTILLARVAEFLNEAGIANVTDDVYESALHTYHTKMQADTDPAFAEKARQAGEQGMPTQQAEQQQPPTAGGLLNAQSQGGM